MRAQTTLDFAAGMSLFLVTVAFVFAFVPGLVGPFADDSGEALVAGDRVADQLGRQLLAAGPEPFVLDAVCTSAFFDLGGAPPADCRFEGTTLHERVGLSERLALNVTVRGEDADGDGSPDVLCDDGNGNVDEAGDPPACATAFAAGPTPPSNTGSVVVARRVVSVDGRDATMLVRMW